ncbi:MATE family efflux transporter [Nibricoccus aquaticus]|nr:MATE family efflux transporter [Nibricoccus aquaticus]
MSSTLLIQESRRTLALAFPIIVGQVGQMLIGITDTALIGRVGTVPLAAAAFTHSVFGVFFIVGIGLLIPVGVFSAREFGAGDLRGCAAWLRHGRMVALAVSAVGVALMALLVTQLDRFGQPPEVVAIMTPFYLLIAASLVPTLFFQVQRQFAESLGHPWVPMMIMLVDVALNALLNWMFIWGHLGAPAMGLTGSGVATLIARTAAVVAIAMWLRRAKALSAVRAAAVNGKWERERFRALWRMGLPAGGAMLFEAGAFGAAALMMGWLGATALAAHQVALSCAAFAFMFPLGLSTAASMRVSNAIGEGRREALRAIGFGALGMSSVFVLVFATAFGFAGEAIARLFSADTAVVALAAKLLLVAAVFQLFDGAQVVAGGALRGLTDVKVPTAITFVAYWMLALPGGYFLGVRGVGPLGVWGALAAGLAFAAVFLAWRFARLTRVAVG